MSEKILIPFYSNKAASYYADCMLYDNNLVEAEWAYQKMNDGYDKQKGLEKCAVLRAKLEEEKQQVVEPTNNQESNFNF